MVGDQCRVFVCSMSDDTVVFTRVFVCSMSADNTVVFTQNEEIRSYFTIVRFFTCTLSVTILSYT